MTQRRRRILVTWRSVHVYFQSQTWSITWSGVKWRWLPQKLTGYGDGGWLFHWIGILVERFCFDEDDWGKSTAERMEHVLGMLEILDDDGIDKETPGRPS